MIHEYKKICRKCGLSFVALGPRAIYCKKCHKTESRQDAYRRRVSKLVDTDAMMRLCLNCTMEDCNGECEMLANVSKGDVC